MTHPPSHIQPMQAAHIPMCAHLVEQVPLFRGYGLTALRATEMFGGALQDSNSTLLVAVEPVSQAVQGFAWFMTRAAFARSGYLRLIAVNPDAHGRGVGRALLESLEASFLSPSGIVLLTSTNNHSAQRFYERLGYQQVGTLPDYIGPGLHEHIYFKPAPTS